MKLGLIGRRMQVSKYGAMRYADKKKRVAKNYNKGYARMANPLNIKCTKHVIDRFRQRMLKNGMPDAEVEKRIVQMVSQSNLIGLADGMEHRSSNGRIFVCKREMHDGIENIIVVTMLMSETLQKEKTNERMDKFISKSEAK